MFGLNLWARPFLPPAPGSMGMENPGGLPRGHPALGLGTPTYLLPGLTAEKAATSSMHSPFAPGSLFMYRPDSMLHPHMLRVNVDQSLHLGQNDSERNGSLPHSLRDPHSSDSGSVESYPSAFQPTKRARLSADDCAPSRVPSRHSDGGHKSDHEPGQFYGTERGSHGSLEERVGGLMTVGRTAGGGSSPRSGRSPDSTYGTSPKDGRQPGGSSPRSEPRTPGGPPRCPVCGQGLAPGEVDAHYAMEMDRLRVLARMERGENAAEGADGSINGRTPTTSSSSSSSSTGGHNGATAVSASASLSVSESRYETYLKIRNNRHVRLCAKTRARRKRPSDTPPHDGMDCREDGDPMSPPHHPHLPSHPHHGQHPQHPASHHPHYQHPHPPHPTTSAATMEPETHQGVSISSSSPHTSPTVIEPIMNHVNSYPAHSYPQRSPLYHTAQRSPTYLTATTSNHVTYQPPAAAHMARSPTNCSQGSPVCQQSPPGRAASPAAVAPTHAVQDKGESDDEDEFIRVDSPRPESVIVNPVSSESQASPASSGAPSTNSERAASPHLAIPASHLARQPVSIKCQVCQGNYNRPVTSVTCWHVHCEDCWLKTLGNKRLCPQCKAITSPSDLRKVYI